MKIENIQVIIVFVHGNETFRIFHQSELQKAIKFVKSEEQVYQIKIVGESSFCDKYTPEEFLKEYLTEHFYAVIINKSIQDITEIDDNREFADSDIVIERSELNRFYLGLCELCSNIESIITE